MTGATGADSFGLIDFMSSLVRPYSASFTSYLQGENKRLGAVSKLRLAIKRMESR